MKPNTCDAHRSQSSHSILSFGCSRAPEPAPPVASTPDPAQAVREMFDTRRKHAS